MTIFQWFQLYLIVGGVWIALGLLATKHKIPYTPPFIIYCISATILWLVWPVLFYFAFGKDHDDIPAR